MLAVVVVVCLKIILWAKASVQAQLSSRRWTAVSIMGAFEKWYRPARRARHKDLPAASSSSRQLEMSRRLRYCCSEGRFKAEAELERAAGVVTIASWSLENR